VRRRYGIDWYAGGRWYSVGRTWLTKWGARRACRRVLRDAGCGAARVVIVRAAARSSAGRPAPWSGAARSPAGGVG